MVCFRYVIVNTMHKGGGVGGGDVDDNNAQKFYNRNR